MDGLMDIQRRYFELLSQLGSKTTTCRALGIQNRQIGRWLREDSAFLKAHEGYFSASRDATASRFQELQEKLPDLAAELMEAMKVISVKHNCFACGMENTIEIDTTNDVVRARMWSDLMKATGHLKDVTKHEGEVVHTVLSAGQRIALEKLRRNLPVSVQQRKELESMGLLEDLQTYDGSQVQTNNDTVEGEVL